MAASRTGQFETESELYDAVSRAIANLHAALCDVDAAWILITQQRPNPPFAALEALNAAEKVVEVARTDLVRARLALLHSIEDSDE